MAQLKNQNADKMAPRSEKGNGANWPGKTWNKTSSY